MKTADNVYMYMRTGSAAGGRADCSIFLARGCTCSGVIGNQKSEITQWFPISDLRLARSVEKCKTVLFLIFFCGIGMEMAIVV